MSKRTPYIDKEKFNIQTCKYIEEYNECLASGLAKPQISQYLAECIILLANKIATMPSFSNYYFKDELVANGIETCVRYFAKYRPDAISARTDEVTSGPFGYFQTIIMRRFLKTISDEKHTMYVRQKYIATSFDTFCNIIENDDPEYGDALKEILEDNSSSDYVQYELKLEAKKAELKARLQLKKQLEEEELQKTTPKVEIILPLGEFFI